MSWVIAILVVVIILFLLRNAGFLIIELICELFEAFFDGDE